MVKQVFCLSAFWLVCSVSASESLFGVKPRVDVTASLAANVAQNVAPSNVTLLRLGMTLQEAFTCCPDLNREGSPGPDGREYGQDCGEKYLLRFLTVVVAKGRVIEIDFHGGFPNPSGEIVRETVEWLFDIFGLPDSAFDRQNARDGSFGLIWKGKVPAVTCLFRSAGPSFYADLALVHPNNDKIFTPRGARELPRTTQTILARLNVWTREVAHLASKPAAFPEVSASPVLLVGGLASRPEKYEVLIGEGFAGSGFVMRYKNALFGICSVHQFDGKVPRTLEALEGDPVQLDRTKAFRQKDIQVLPIKATGPNLEFLNYNPDFALRVGDNMLILGPAGGLEPGKLTGRGLKGTTYESTDGPRLLEVRSARLFAAEGGSGCPIIQKASGNVVGVLTTADDGEKARLIGFQTLCLPK